MTRDVAPIHPPRKPIRLDTELYAQPGLVCSITIGTKDRLRVFEMHELASTAVEVLRERAQTHGVAVYAYCFMPDHVHILISPSTTRDLITFVGQFKNLVQREAWRLGRQGTIWQKRFWDHFLRQEEDVETVVQYILMNPVRAGLVEQWEQYPHSGSLIWKSLNDPYRDS